MSLFRIDQVPNDAAAAWPWTANIFVEDEQVLIVVVKACRCMKMYLFSAKVCGATLVHAKFILTELECVTKATGKYVVVLIGQERRTRVGLSPWAQVKKSF